MTTAAPHSSLASPRAPVARRARAPASAAVRDIVFASDLSPASERAFDHARLLAERFGASLSLYHAIEVDSVDEIGDPPEPAREIWRRVELAAREQLNRSLAGAALTSEIRLERTTSVDRALVDFIRAARPDLTVMATHGRGGIARFVLGSLTEHVLRHTRAPVLCVREPEHGVALPYRRVLVPTDLSPASRRAFPLAAQLARAFDAEVLAVHAVELHTRSLSGVTDAMESLVASEDALLAFFQPEFAGARILPRVQLGSPWERITQTAYEDRADVIVMTTNGCHRQTDRVLGKHAERVVRLAPCPVLVA